MSAPERQRRVSTATRDALGAAPMTSRDPRQVPLDYAAKGFRVLPLTGKIPRNPNGCHGATTDPDAITRWWRMWPDADVGIATGSGLVVLDVDPRHGGDESLEQIEAELGVIWTLTARTGGGGLHFYFGGDLPGRTGFRPGLDLKAGGGYVVAPPSLHATGVRYEWVADHPEGPQPIPTWLAELVDPPRPICDRSFGPTATAPTSPRYVQAAIAAECGAVATAPEGQRNHTLNAAGFALARFVASGEVDGAAVARQLARAAASAGLGHVEIERTLWSAFRARGAA